MKEKEKDRLGSGLCGSVVSEHRGAGDNDDDDSDTYIHTVLVHLLLWLWGLSTHSTYIVLSVLSRLSLSLSSSIHV